jgi:NAD(P)-dependent dehydrogenase (short-subunit alcohol dehydrogenase family)
VDLSGTVVVVTGASGGIGGGVARAFAVAGAAVVAQYRNNLTAAAELVEEIERAGGRALAVHADVTDPAACDGLMAAATRGYGRLDAVVAAAGVQPVADLAAMTVPQWREVVEVNLTGAFATVQAAAAVMRASGGGSIVLIASIEGARPAWSHAHYSASKAAVISFTRGAALEYGCDDIRVNTVSPGLIWRDGLAREWPDGVDRWTRAAPLRRLGTGSDVGDACVFLASPMSRWITGHDLVVDGGMSVQPSW